MRVLGLEQTGELVTTTVMSDSTPAFGLAAALIGSALAQTSSPSAVRTGSSEHEIARPLLKKWMEKSMRQTPPNHALSPLSQPSQHGLCSEAIPPCTRDFGRFITWRIRRAELRPDVRRALP